jgi:PAS domain S-box-containing protein
MPRLGGIAVIRAMRADERTRQIPIMLLSARAGEEARIEGMEAGADDYLTKPFSTRELLARVRSQLTLMRLRREALQHEQQLRAAEALVRVRLERILEGIKDDFVMYDDDWRYVYVNSQAAQSLGYPREELIGQCIWDLFPNAVGNLFHREMLAAKATGRETVFEHYYAPWNKWIENRAYPIPDGMLLFAADVTERKLAEAALRLSEERVRLAISVAQLGTWHYNPNTGMVTLDERMRNIWGEPAESEMLSIDAVLARIHPDDREHVIAAITTALNPDSTGVYEIEYRIVWPDQTERWIAANGQAQFIGSGEEQHLHTFIGTALDITERKRAEVKRERQLVEEQRLRAQAEEASRLKDEFLATVSHELRTPLTAFLGYAQLLQRRPRDPAYVARTVDRMVRSANDQAQLIEDLLDVSRIVSGKLRLEMARIDLLDVVNAALDTVRPALEAKNLVLQLELRPDRSSIMGDANRLQQVVWNLLSNATKFTPSGGHVLVRLIHTDGQVELTVSDTGQGISPAFLPYVFDRFRQADGTSSRAHAGLGLGLSIVRHLVELHGGTVAAASAGDQQGATFTVRLPLISPHRTAATLLGAPETDALDTAEQHPPELDGLRVLVVDDQRPILDFVQEVLSSCGAVVKACASARDALEVIRIWQPDVLLSDIAMPGEDGYWLIREVRALTPAEGGHTPAAALTAYVRAEERLRVLGAGFQQYVTKPVDMHELVEVVARLARTTLST